MVIFELISYNANEHGTRLAAYITRSRTQFNRALNGYCVAKIKYYLFCYYG